MPPANRPPLTTPITFDDVLAAQERLRPHLTATPLRHYQQLDDLVGHGVRVSVKHENHQPTQSFKIRNGLSAILSLTPEQRALGVIGATTGNHGQGLAYGGQITGTKVTICVPEGNNPSKNAAIRALGAELIEVGATYDDTRVACDRIAVERGLTLVHSTNNKNIIAGAATMTLEILEQQPDLDALVIANGGGSQAVGAITVGAQLKPALKIYGVSAANAPAQYEAWKRGEHVSGMKAATFAEGIATGSSYDMTFDALYTGLAGYFTVTEDEMYRAVRDLINCTHNLAEGSGAAGFAALRKHAAEFEGQKVCVVMCGGNMSEASLLASLSA
jgi:threonine dehydratase